MNNFNSPYGLKKRNAKRYAAISGISIIMHVISEIIHYVLLRTVFLNFSPSILGIFGLCIDTAIAVLIIMTKKNPALVVLCGVGVLWESYEIAQSIVFTGVDMSDVVYLLMIDSMFILILYNGISKFSEMAKLTKAGWFVPGTLMLVYCIINGIHTGLYNNSGLLFRCIYVFGDIFRLVALWTAGLWIRAENGDVK